MTRELIPYLALAILSVFNLALALEAVQFAAENKNKAVTPLVVITLLVALADLAFNILRFLGVF